jgi:hypothetical protein
MVVPLAVSRAKAQPPHRRMGKDKAKADSGETGVNLAYKEAAAAMPEGICTKEGIYSLLCFCCPMPLVESYRRQYVSEEGGPPVLSNLGKSIIDLHSEFAAWKAAGESAIREAQSTHSKIFHQDEELAAVIAQCKNQVGIIPYGPTVEEIPDWICNMPLEEQIWGLTSAPNMVEAATLEVSEWQAAKGGRQVTKDTGPLTLHTIMQGGPVNLRWTSTNRFAPIIDAEEVSTPSKVTDNA